MTSRLGERSRADNANLDSRNDGTPLPHLVPCRTSLSHGTARDFLDCSWKSKQFH